jgi:hypothetical protein
MDLLLYGPVHPLEPQGRVLDGSASRLPASQDHAAAWLQTGILTVVPSLASRAHGRA